MAAPAEPPRPAIARPAIEPPDAAPPDDAPSAPKLACDDADTTPAQGRAPEASWYCTRGDGRRHGPFVSLFPDGTPEIEGSYRNDVLDGTWKRHHANGVVVEEGTYNAGRKTGRWIQSSPTGTVIGEYDMVGGTGIDKRWLDDGTRYSEIGLRGGVLHGGWKIFAPDGSIMQGVRYVNGVREGVHAVGTTKTVRIDEKYVRGVRTGARTIWQFGLKLAEENFDRRGKHDGAYTLWRTARVARVKGQFARGKRTGPWVWTDRDNNKEREGTYVDGKRDGWWIEWADGKVVFTGNYNVGRPDGEHTYWDKNGNELGSFSMRDGTGIALSFHANHKPATRQKFVKGVEDGVYQELTNKGKVTVEGFFRAAQKHGVWKEWTPEGVLLLEQTWKRGLLDGVVKKYVDGKPSLEARYIDGKAHGLYVEMRAGRPAVTGQFVDDRRTGTWTHYNADGSVILTATYQAGILEGPWRQLVDGVVVAGQMLAGRRVGTWTRTDKAGVVRKLTYGLP